MSTVMAADLVSDDDRSVAADSWSVKSDYGSNVEDEQRHVEASEILSGGNFPPSSDYSSDKDVPDANEVEASMLGLQSYWDATYAECLTNIHEHGSASEVWFGSKVMDATLAWTKGLCMNIYQGQNADNSTSSKSELTDSDNGLSNLSVLDIGTGNGLLLQELAKQGFSDLTGIDYSRAAIKLAQDLAARDGFSYIKFLVDDILESKLDKKYHLVMDKGTLDSIGMHPDGPAKRISYWESVSNLVASGGTLVIASCNNMKDELLQEVETLNRRRIRADGLHQEEGGEPAVFQYLDHFETSHDGDGGSHVFLVAFVRK
ncbi:uncharacterized protein A4U43_C01F29110 [Asparagus officinalis]|uniref:Protein-lysine N-methyltransferase A4U43_C01F29110 n=1 Tax=Asparagus officinalis TaxID=4686 RepID=A0A5P1FWS4_ASPOF|nr:protein-lysine N-methyltransferase mettl10-like [Asparagus officinalis]ONK81440.1 uncharacterized protein A4U43_C01F29110 [Asparagus officinalis]